MRGGCRGVTHLVEEKSNYLFKVDIIWAMGGSLPEAKT